MPPFKDLTGQRFNKLTVIKRVENYLSASGRKESRWLCRCDCGRETMVTTGHLKDGTTKSCGCLCSGGQKGLIDLTGQRFGDLLVLGRADKDFTDSKGRRYPQWNCECSCGRTVTVRGSYLRNGSTTSCGICKLDEKFQDQITIGDNGRVIADLTGKTFGRLTVVGRGEDYISSAGRHSRRWECKCSCGNPKTLLVYTHYLLSGHTKSCGCMKTGPAPDRQKQNRFEFRDDFVIGYTDRGRPFFFDYGDYDRVKKHCWCETTGGYIVSRFTDGSIVRLHRFIMDAEPREIVDHINHDVTDNRRCNLRIVDNIHSMMNIGISTRNKSGIKGVYFKDGKWTASIRVNMKEKYFGTFDDIEEAAMARRAAEIKYFGEHNYDESIAAVPRIEGIPWVEPLERYRVGEPDGADVDEVQSVLPDDVPIMPLPTQAVPMSAAAKEAPSHQPSALIKEESPMAQVPNHHVHYTGRTIRTSSTMI